MIKVMQFGAVSESEIFARSSSSRDVSGTVREILENVRTRGDEALIE